VRIFSKKSFTKGSKPVCNNDQREIQTAEGGDQILSKTP